MDLRYLKEYLGCISLCLYCSFGFAGTAPDTALRDKYLAAEAALQQGDSQHYQQLAKQLTHYPLYPYLLYKQLVPHVGSLSPAYVRQFTRRYPHSPLAQEVYEDWLVTMAKQQRWSAFLSVYHPTDNEKLQCLYWQAQAHTTGVQAPQTTINTLWLSAESQPDECNDIFQQWREQNQINSAMVWQRMQLALESNNTELGRYLFRLLGDDQKNAGQLLLQAHQTPQQSNTQLLKTIALPQARDIAFHRLYRLAKINPSLAEKAWQTAQTQYHFTTSQHALFAQTIAKKYLFRKPELAQAWLAQIEPQNTEEKSLQWRVRLALQNQQWQEISNLYLQLPPAIQQKPFWQYWYARSLEQQQQRQTAQAIYQQLAKKRTYYGFLAADKIAHPHPLQHHQLPISKIEQQAVGNHPGLLRVRELLALGRDKQAEKEWWHTIRTMNDKQRYIAAKLAQQWGWHDLALKTTPKIAHKHDMHLRFPVRYKQLIQTRADQYNLAPALIFALIRQESMFQKDVTSSAGAKGLMQLMPYTAKKVAKKLRYQLSHQNQLYQPAANIYLGTTYLNTLLDRFEHPLLALAAYNAGPHRVKRWLPKQQTPMDIWVETVPFYETRGYIKHALGFFIIYSQLLNDATGVDRLFDDIPIAPHH